MKYDLSLLEELNKEYKNKPVQKSFNKYDHEYQFNMAEKRLAFLNKLTNINNKRVLEVGCGGGYVSRKLVSDYGCTVTAIDITKSGVWDELGPQKGLDFRVLDLSQSNPFQENEFDLIISYVAWEHMRHPFKILKECTKVLNNEGKFFIYANLYRSTVASHLYRNIYFPFPHLLFPEEVIREYCLSQGVTQEWIDSFFYVNKLTYSHYKEYFRILNLELVHERLIKRNLDMDFYQRFESKLGLYPKFDLELDFFEVILVKGKD